MPGRVEVDGVTPVVSCRRHPAPQQLRTLRFHSIDNDALLAYSKFDPASGDTVLGMAPYERFWVRDESGEEYQWGQDNYVRLDPVMSAQARTEQLHRR